MHTPVIVNPDAGTPAGPAPADLEFHDVVVARKARLADGIWLFELRDPEGAELPAYTPGSHLTVQVPSGARRNYSLCGDPAERGVHQIAVKREGAGRGGSASMVDEVAEGQVLRVSLPRNNFELAARAKRFLFVAGGIGITPILSMMRHLKNADGRPFTLYYLTREPGSTAFLRELEEEFPGQVKVHHDQGVRENAFDLWPVLERQPPGTHVYCCGPKPLMDSVQGMTGHWNAGTVHFESFGVDARAQAANRPFLVRLARSGATLEVAADQTILGVLRAHGHRVPSSCESGTCGSCRTRLLSGTAEHRDAVLTEDEQADQIMVCVSRAVSPELLLDL